jgi:hypothetical protein
MGSSSWVAAPAGDDVDRQRSTPTSTMASPTSLWLHHEEYELARSRFPLLWIWSSSAFAPPSASPVLALDFSGDELGRYVYRFAVQPGWILPTTYFGGLIPLLGVLSSGVWGLLVLLEAPNPFSFGDVMAACHLFRPARSMAIKCADAFVILLLVPCKNCVYSSGRRSASSSKWLQPLATRTTGRMTVQGLCCNFFFLQGCLCKSWNVNFMKYI